MLRSVARLNAVRPGFAADHLLTFRLALPDVSYKAPATRVSLVNALTDRLALTPGVLNVAVNSRLPLGGARSGESIAIEGRPPKPGELLIADQRRVTATYFRAMRIPILEGRGFTERDDAGAEPIAIVNRTMARQFWPDGGPLNARVRGSGGPNAPWIRIVGVVGDVHHVSLSHAPVAEMYRPFAQDPTADFSVVVRTAGEPSASARVSRAVVEALDRDLPVYDLRTMDERVAGSFASLRATMLLLLVTAMLAAILAGTAIYGSIWYAVSLRIPEIGIRLALGATPASVCMRIVGQAVVLALGGATLGTAVAVAAGPMLRSLLFETPPTDPATHAAVAMAVVVLAIAASIVPSVRAMRIDPITALRTL
jgi:putative ABC transport system permease protein